MNFMDKETTAINNKKFVIKDHFSSNDFTEIEGSPFVKHDALLRVAKSVLGICDKTVSVVEQPSKQNEWSTVVIVNYKFFDGFGFSGIGEARTSNVKPKMSMYTSVLAETRASSRALRFALGVDFCSYEELASTKKIDDDEEDNPIDDQQLRVIEKFKEKGVNPSRIMEIVQKTGKKTTKDLSFSEARDVIKELNKIK